jgi:hypothetical protein
LRRRARVLGAAWLLLAGPAYGLDPQPPAVPEASQPEAAGGPAPSGVARVSEAIADAAPASADPVPGTPAEPALAPVPGPSADPTLAPLPGPSADPALAPVHRLAAAFQVREAQEPLDARVARVRREASRMGMVSAERAAQGVLLAERLGNDAERARAAVRLAPGLPSAWGALAVASPGFAALPALLRAVLELERNLDASVWLRATASRVLAWALVLGGALFLVVAAARGAPAAAHDLSHRVPGRLPPHALAAILVGVGMLPAVLGEGLVGLAAGAFVVALPWAPPSGRAALVFALAAVVAGLHPVTDETGRWIAALDADPVTVAIRNAEVGGLSPAQRERLERLAERDPAAVHALVLWSKRTGRIDEAAAWLAGLDPEAPPHAVLLNDAANVRLAAGDDAAAIELYQLATELERRPEIYFNLAQVHGSRIELGEQERALAAAQALSASTVRELMELRGDGRLAADLTWPTAELRARLASAADGSAVAAELRRSFGAGRLSGSPQAAGAAFLGVALLGMALGRGRIESRACAGCGARRCDRCNPVEGKRCALCGAPPESASPLQRALPRARRLVRRLVPGVAGLAAERPWLGWLAAVSSVAAVSAFALRKGVVADPLAAGLAGQLAFVLAGLLALLVCAVVTAWALRDER